MTGMGDPLPNTSGELASPKRNHAISRWWARIRQETPEVADARTRTDEEVTVLIERIAEWVDKRRLETPAILFLESHKPFAYLGSEFLLVGTPAAAPLFGLQNLENLYRLMEKSENVDRL